MKNFHVLLAEIMPEKRSGYIEYITQTFNEAGNDWRTKELLAKNLGKYVTLFDSNIVYQEFLPMFFKFLEDRVARVSEAASTALAPILIKFTGDSIQQRAIIKIIKNNYYNGEKAIFKRRQLFVIMCSEVMNQSKELFEEHFKHDMLSLVSDRVLNVRICLARALRDHFKTINCTFMYDPFVNQAVKVMKQDKCQDVLDLVQEIASYQMASEESSNSSRASGTSDDNLTVASFMDTLNRSRRSSSSTVEGEISQMEESIVQKAGIEISKNTDAKQTKTAQSAATHAEEAKEVPAPMDDKNVNGAQPTQADDAASGSSATKAPEAPPAILAPSTTVTSGTEEELPVKKEATEGEQADSAPVDDDERIA